MRRFAALIPLVAIALPLGAQTKPKVATLDTAVFAVSVSVQPLMLVTQ